MNGHVQTLRLLVPWNASNSRGDQGFIVPRSELLTSIRHRNLPSLKAEHGAHFSNFTRLLLGGLWIKSGKHSTSQTKKRKWASPDTGSVWSEESSIGNRMETSLFFIAQVPAKKLSLE